MKYSQLKRLLFFPCFIIAGILIIQSAVAAEDTFDYDQKEALQLQLVEKSLPAVEKSKKTRATIGNRSPADTDKNGSIDYDEFEKIMENDDDVNWFERIDNLNDK
ncbi:MAG: hypothetical protein KAQ98_12015 [Bacteriovoracaceae bacterium]|nr:hypothetical protein [Bacteriovoracaceae bacterium]